MQVIRVRDGLLEFRKDLGKFLLQGQSLIW